MQAYLPQLPQSEKPTTSTLPNFLPKLPSPPPKPPNASTFPLKRQRVYRQTPKRFRQNVKEFPSKRKDVSPPSYLPTLLFPESTYKNTPKPLPESSRHAQFMRQ